MTANSTDASVHASVVVRASVERAFSVFTEDMASWWPPEHHILQGELAEMVFEPRQAATCTTAPRTEACAIGHAFWCTSRRPAW